MEKFIKLDNILINVDRLVAIRHEPELKNSAIEQSEHYLALFDTGQKIMLGLAEGAALMEHCQRPS